MKEQAAVDDGERRVVEVEARTVDEAVARGLVRLGGLSRAEVQIDVLSEGRGGLLGFGAEVARVRLTVLPYGQKSAEPPTDKPDPAAPAPSAPTTEPRPEADASRPRREPKADESTATRPRRAAKEDEAATSRPRRAPEVAEVVTPRPRRAPKEDEAADSAPPPPLSKEDEAAAEVAAREVVGILLGHLGYEDVTLSVKESLLPVKMEDEQSLVLSIGGPTTERLLTDEARALQALQFITRLIIGRHMSSWVNLLLDVGGDRARQMKELFQLAEQSAVLVEREGRPVSLPPMKPYERRVVHLALKDHPTVATQSIGSGEFRKVTIRRKDQMLPEL